MKVIRSRKGFYGGSPSVVLPIRSVPISYHSSSSWKHGYFQAASWVQESVVEEMALVTEWARSLIMRFSV
jgi:hypothetical protein